MRRSIASRLLAYQLLALALVSGTGAALLYQSRHGGIPVLWGAGLLVALASGLWWLKWRALRRHLIAPLGELAGAVEALGAGDLSRRAGSERADEIGNLGRAFDTMAARLEQQAAVLRDSEARYRVLVDSASDIIYSTDAEGRFTFANPVALRAMGFADEGEVLGRPFLELIRPDMREAVAEVYYAQARERVANTYCEFAAVRRDGGEVWIGQNVQLVQEDGRTVGFQAIARDITERRRADEEMRRAREQAEAASRAKSDFLANMSHEIRTPMNGIIGMSELLLEGELAPEQREQARAIRDSGEALLGLINGVLEFSKMEAARLELEEQPFALAETVGDAVRTLGVAASRKGLELAFRVAADVPEALSGDAARLRQVLVNLLGNAVKFTARGEVVLEVACAPPVEGEVALQFTVRDTGVGIPAAKQQSVFEPFTQGDPSTTRRYGGTGLGLAISKQLVALMGGRIWVDSEPGRGSAFHFTARFRPATAPARAAAHPARLADLAVLIVDDAATSRAILSEMLARWRMQPAQAGNAQEALALLRRRRQDGHPFDLVLLDAGMPGLDGFLVAEAVRADPGLAAAAVVMLSSSEQHREAARCRELALPFVVKPVKSSHLLDAMLVALGSPGEEAPSPSPADEPLTGRRLRVLVAEDNPVNQRVVTTLLERRGHRVTMAGNGREALALIQRAPFDAVLMDVQMPEMDGFEATAAIRALERDSGEHLPVVALTAHAMTGDREACLAAGMDGYVSKPIRTPELLAALDAALRGSAAAAPAPQFEPAALLDLVQGDTALLAEIVGLFREQSPRILADMWRAVEDGDARALQRAAHLLKGSVRHFGPSAAAAAAERLEESAREGRLVSAAEMVSALQHQVQELSLSLSSLVQPLAGSS